MAKTLPEIAEDEVIVPKWVHNKRTMQWKLTEEELPAKDGNYLAWWKDGTVKLAEFYAPAYDAWYIPHTSDRTPTAPDCWMEIIPPIVKTIFVIEESD